MNLLESRTSVSGRSTPFLRSPASSCGGSWIGFNRTPASSFGGDRPSSARSNASAITFALALVACVLIFIQTCQERGHVSSEVLGQKHWTSGAVTRDAAVEQLLLKKEQELETLRTQLQSTVAGNSVKEGSMQAQESSIKLLQERTEKERVARTKAQFALSERQQQGAKCLSDVELLERELALCSKEVTSAKGGGGKGSQQ